MGERPLTVNMFVTGHLGLGIGGTTQR